MNQILNFEEDYKNNKKRNKGNKNLIDIKKIIIVFAIILIIFGIGIIANAVYNLYGKGNNETEKLSKPSINLTPNTETGKLDIVIKHDRAIASIVYSWNGQDEVTEKGKNRNYINLSVEIPSGTNEFKIKAIDIKNSSVEYVKEYTREEVKIELSQGNGGVSISVTSEKEISYITYKWNDATDERIDVNSKEYETTIKVPKGENTLTVVAVDVDGIETKRQTKVQGIVDEKPKLDITVDAKNFILTAEDDEGIEKVIIRANGEDKTIEVGEKNFEYKVPIIDGYNQVQIKVYNINGLTNYKKATLNK